MGIRREARETALTILYLMDVSSLKQAEAEDVVFKDNKLPDQITGFTKILVSGTAENIKIIDDLITKQAKNWELSRMSAIDRNILRIGTFEILKTPETPISVIINEAVEIAKKYSTSDSSKFVNGILDKFNVVRKKT
ncbi:MAG: transcription antitermination factor NusB [Elusimicrobiota bacterium]